MAYPVVSALPPSAGGVSTCETFRILSGYGHTAMGFQSTAAVHWQVAALRRVYGDRNNKRAARQE
nr:gamma-glutamyltransferase [Sphingomonas sp. AAP5]